MIRLTDDVPAVFIGDAERRKFYEVQQFYERESRDFNPYRVQLTAHEILQAAKKKWGRAACYELEFWIH